MKNVRAVLFITGVMVFHCLLSSVALANEANDAVDQTEKGKKKRGILSELFSPIGMRYWNPNIGGNVKVNGNSHIGDKLHLDHDLDLKVEGADQLSTSPDVVGLADNGKLRLGYECYELTGDKRLADSVNFQDNTYTAGEKLNSTLKIRYVTVKWLPDYRREGDHNASLMLGLVNYGHKIKVSGEAERSEKRFTGTIPVIGYRMENGRAENTVYYAEASVYPAKHYYYNAEAGVVQRYGDFAIGVGYRVCAQKEKSGNDYLEYKATGPFVQALYRF
jgi:hypothetical protein